MFKCFLLVDKVTADDDSQPPGMAFAEAIQLTRQDPVNIKRLVERTVNKLTSPSVVVRVKSLRFLNHLAQNGPPACVTEVKLNTTAISNTIGFRGQPHPTRGWEPYQEMKEAAQSLLDLSFSAQAAPIQSFSAGNTSGAPFRAAGISSMESYGNDQVYQQAPSLEPRNLDPTARNYTGEVKDFFQKAFNMGPTTATTSKYGAASNVASGSQEAVGYSTNIPVVAAAPPPPRALMGRRDVDVTFSKRAEKLVEPAKIRTDTPTSKLLKVTGARAMPTNGELTAYGAALTPDAIDELRIGLNDPDWKVKVRAISGLEVYGGKFGLGPVASVKDRIDALKGAPQASLRTVATRFFEAIKDVQPTADPSAFDFAGDAPQPADDDAQGFDFGS
jgi:hypothetical protein